MPQVLPLIATILGIASSGATLGLDIASAVGDKGSPSSPTSMPNATPAPTPGPSGPTPGQQSALVQAASNLASNDPYSSSTYYSTLAPSLAGVQGGAPNIDALIKKALGIGGPSMTPSGTPSNLLPLASSPGISDYMSKTAAVIA